jgi:hypothetical protein
MSRFLHLFLYRLLELDTLEINAVIWLKNFFVIPFPKVFKTEYNNNNIKFHNKNPEVDGYYIRPTQYLPMVDICYKFKKPQKLYKTSKKIQKDSKSETKKSYVYSWS